MSRPIKLNDEMTKQIVADFIKEILSAPMYDGKISYNRSIFGEQEKARVLFSEIAWLKMKTLVKEMDKEVGWHGVARRGENNDYYIDDIIVYPQEVTGATVTPDQKEYEMWLMEQPDEIFNNIRMQGHSHVNMGVTPSGVDTTFYEKILSQLDDTMFYIFMIWNKKDDKTIRIYDMEKNIMFDTKDVDVEILDDGTGIEKFMKDAKGLVKEKTYAKTFNASYGYKYGGYYDEYDEYDGYYTSKPYSIPEKKDDKDEKPDDKVKDVTSVTKRRKGKRKK